MPTEAEIAWAAGFIEGDGAFLWRESRVQVECVDLDILERLHALFGGTILRNNRMKTKTSTPTCRWYNGGEASRRTMLAIYPYLSLRRRGQAITSYQAGRNGLCTGPRFPRRLATRPIISSTEWAAGLFDAEGTISRQTHSVQITSSDLDVLTRLPHALSAGYVNGPTTPGTGGLKPMYRWNVGMKSDVLHVIDGFTPYVSARRRLQLDDVRARAVQAAGINPEGCRAGIHRWDEGYERFDIKGLRYCAGCKADYQRRNWTETYARRRAQSPD